MVEFLKTFRQLAIEVLSKTHGEDLQISANLTSPSQFKLILETYAHKELGASFVVGEEETYLRITKAYNSKFGDYVSNIAQTPEYKGGDMIASQNDI